ncbi:hypothetical protein ES703_97065 [subsurface metagenome]
MRQTTEVFIPIPKVRNTHCKVEIAGDDQTSRMISSKFIYPTTIGIGTFIMNLSNAFGQLTGKYQAGDVVKFYADNKDNTTLQFLGRIDYVKDNISSEGQFLGIEGRHRSYLLTEHLVCHLATGTSPSQILKDIIDKLPESYGFTYTNVKPDTDSMDVEWNYKPFWDCVFELCKHSKFDCYVDNDLDFHYFEANSIVNERDAIVEGDNFIRIKDWGTNDTYEKTRVTAIGQDDSGLPIIHTAINPNEEDEIKEVFIRPASANTETKVRNIAEAKLEELTNRAAQAKIVSYGLETVKPGENIWLLIPREKIHGQYKLLQITHEFGAKSGGWRTECSIEEEDVGVSQMIQKVSRQTKEGTKPDNIHKMNYSWNFDFLTDRGTHSDTEIIDGVLKVVSGESSGTWTSEVLEIAAPVTSVESRIKGNNLTNTEVWLSVNGGINFFQIGGPGTRDAFYTSGKDLQLRVNFFSSASEASGLALLYK